MLHIHNNHRDLIESVLVTLVAAAITSIANNSKGHEVSGAADGGASALLLDFWNKIGIEVRCVWCCRLLRYDERGVAEWGRCCGKLRA